MRLALCVENRFHLRRRDGLVVVPRAPNIAGEAIAAQGGRSTLRRPRNTGPQWQGQPSWVILRRVAPHGALDQLLRPVDAIEYKNERRVVDAARAEPDKVRLIYAHLERARVGAILDEVGILDGEDEGQQRPANWQLAPWAADLWCQRAL